MVTLLKFIGVSMKSVLAIGLAFCAFTFAASASDSVYLNVKDLENQKAKTVFTKSIPVEDLVRLNVGESLHYEFNKKSIRYNSKCVVKDDKYSTCEKETLNLSSSVIITKKPGGAYSLEGSFPKYSVEKFDSGEGVSGEQLDLPMVAQTSFNTIFSDPLNPILHFSTVKNGQENNKSGYFVTLESERKLSERAQEALNKILRE